MAWKNIAEAESTFDYSRWLTPDYIKGMQAASGWIRHCEVMAARNIYHYCRALLLVELADEHLRECV